MNIFNSHKLSLVSMFYLFYLNQFLLFIYLSQMHPPFSTCTQVIHTCTVLSYTTYRRLTEQLAPACTFSTVSSLFYSRSLIFFWMAIFQVFTDKTFYIVRLRSHGACSPVLVAEWWLECTYMYVTSKQTTTTKRTVSLGKWWVLSVDGARRSNSGPDTSTQFNNKEKSDLS